MVGPELRIQTSEQHGSRHGIMSDQDTREECKPTDLIDTLSSALEWTPDSIAYALAKKVKAGVIHIDTKAAVPTFFYTDDHGEKHPLVHRVTKEEIENDTLTPKDTFVHEYPPGTGKYPTVRESAFASEIINNRVNRIAARNGRSNPEHREALYREVRAQFMDMTIQTALLLDPETIRERQRIRDF